MLRLTVCVNLIAFGLLATFAFPLFASNAGANKGARASSGKFKDVTLEQCIGMARDHLGISRFLNDVRSKGQEITNSSPKGVRPELSFELGGNGISNFSDQEVYPMAQGKIRYPLLNSLSIDRDQEVLELQSTEMNLDSQKAYQHLFKEVANAYLEAQLAQERVKNISGFFTHFQNLKKEVSARISFGAAAKSGLTEIDLEIDDIGNKVKLLEQHYQHAAERLSELIGCKKQLCRPSENLTLAIVEQNESGGKDSLSLKNIQNKAALERKKSEALDSRMGPKLFVEGVAGVPPIIDRFKERKAIFDIRLSLQWDLYDSKSLNAQRIVHMSKAAIIDMESEIMKKEITIQMSRIKEEVELLSQEFEFLNQLNSKKFQLLKLKTKEYKSGLISLSEVVGLLKELKENGEQSAALKYRSWDYKYQIKMLSDFGTL